MKRWLKRRFALSDEGVVAVIAGSIETALENIACMVPVGLLFLLVKDLLNDTVATHTFFYIAGSAICLAVILVIAYFQYNGTYLATYVETGKRRILLAEKLRKIPLAYFAKRDLADLTTSLMNDCDVLEKSQSHFLPPLIGAVISTTLMSCMLFFLDWKMAVSVLWVLPISFVLILCSSRVQNHLMKKTTDARVSYESGIQECIEAADDLRSNNAGKLYLEGLEQKIKAFEKHSIWAEFGKASFIAASGLILRFGIATTVFMGAALLIDREIDLFTFLFFMLIVSRIYDPLDAALQNLAMIVSTNTNTARMNEILDQKVQDGAKELTNKGYDIVFKNVVFPLQRSRVRSQHL